MNLYISHDEFISVNNVLREQNEMEEEIKNPVYDFIYGRYKQKMVQQKWHRNNTN